ncbi:GH1 family beta-glucosidase [Jeotgalibacillus sp. ET6]|uniref:GH1 family beta-glucosidase n=1 Tax=Jeotgalibacillus sp. ET6 TaxID=3037260 RepID=UPI002418AEF4|nr:GH1 family beta-glucosidase [Jeotgalibacillus sp. ET6]MDG5472203.1 GH1 family beta-glucosidase [Jeotgalibacillus sp. ET6]
MSKIQFPEDFIWGTATASYQIEGAANEGGRGASIWDTFSKQPGNVKNEDNGDVACNSYHLYKEDVALLKELGVSTYRFSMAWPRIFPNGDGELSQEGLDYYHRLVDELLEHNIKPMCTLYHWDLPQALQDRGGWESRETVEAFDHYAKTVFSSFKGKISTWITINEPWCASYLSNYLGIHAPGKKDLQAATTIAHHLMLAHGRAVQSLREIDEQAQIGYAPNAGWSEAYSDSEQDQQAVRRANGWQVEWFMDPVFKGEYPDFLVNWFKEKENVTVPIQEGDMDVISSPIDFVGINYYTGNVARYDEGNGLFHVENLDFNYERTDIGWPIYPEGFYQLLTYLNQRYGQVPIYITENGACYNDGVENGEVKDDNRISYMKSHIASVHRAMQSGVNVKGYLAWSLMDNFEWAEGYDMRFGIVHVNFDTLERTKKNSYYWYKNLISQSYFDLIKG